MDHKSYLAQIGPETRTAMTERNDLHGLAYLVVHVGAIVLCGWMILQGWWWMILPQGILIVFLFTLEHECTHQTPFRSKWLNEAVGHICGLALVLPFRWFRYFHLAHHKWTNIAGKDPELEQEIPYGAIGLAWHVSGIPYWVGMVRNILGLALGQPVADYIPDRAIAGARSEARLMIVAYIILLAVWPALFLVWLLPALIGQPFLRLYLLAEHGDCPQVTNMFANTRTTLTNALVRRLAWNMPFHAEHHVWPAVPFHKLPLLHNDLSVHLQVTADGYIAFEAQYLARRLQPNEPTGTKTRSKTKDAP